MERKPENIIQNKSFDFALKIIEFTELLQKNYKWNLAKQLFRCGTTIGANINEAQNAEGLKDFIHKLKVAAKESEETIYWISLCNESENYPKNFLLEKEATEIRNMLNKIISTSRTKLREQKN